MCPGNTHLEIPRQNDGIMSKIQKGEIRGKLFSSEYQPKNRRQPRIFTVLKQHWGIDVDLKGALKEFSRQQINDVLIAVLYGDPRETMVLNKKLNKEFKEIQVKLNNGEDVKIPREGKLWQIYLAFSSAIQKETINGRTDTTRWILEFLLGRPTQTIEGELTNTNVQANQDLSALTTEELNTYLELQRKIQAGQK